MNKAKRILNITEAFMASGFVKAIQQASSSLGSLYRSLDASINSLETMLQEPVDEKNINKVDKYLRGLDARVDNFGKALSDLQYKISELRDEFIKYARKESGIE